MISQVRQPAPRTHLPLRQLALCLDCDECFGIDPETCAPLGVDGDEKPSEFTQLFDFASFGYSISIYFGRFRDFLGSDYRVRGIFGARGEFLGIFGRGFSYIFPFWQFVFGAESSRAASAVVDHVVVGILGDHAPHGGCRILRIHPRQVSSTPGAV